ncbi:MAG: hypothetical protein JWN03_5286, partial [Nocardia sp.]|uniref:helix-turn-helix domain-containing protein n=1 Tax=Nocardia sp. TaxID=1821 RepID=UPI0026120691
MGDSLLNPVVQLRALFEGLPAVVRHPIEMVVFGGDLPRADVSGMRAMASELRAKAAEINGHVEDARTLLALEQTVGTLGDGLRTNLAAYPESAAKLQDQALILADRADGTANDAEKTLCVMFAFGMELGWRILRLVGSAAAVPGGELAAAPEVEAMLAEGRAEVGLMRAGLERAYERGAMGTAARLSALGPIKFAVTLGKAAALPAGVDAGVQLLQVAAGYRSMTVIGKNGENPKGIDLKSIFAAGAAGAGGAVGGMIAGKFAPTVFPRLANSRVALDLVHGAVGAVSGLGAAALVTGLPQHHDQVLAALLNSGLAGVVHGRGGAHLQPRLSGAAEIDGSAPFAHPDLPAAALGQGATEPELSAESIRTWAAAKDAWSTPPDPEVPHHNATDVATPDPRTDVLGQAEPGVSVLEDRSQNEILSKAPTHPPSPAEADAQRPVRPGVSTNAEPARPDAEPSVPPRVSATAHDADRPGRGSGTGDEPVVGTGTGEDASRRPNHVGGSGKSVGEVGEETPSRGPERVSAGLPKGSGDGVAFEWEKNEHAAPAPPSNPENRTGERLLDLGNGQEVGAGVHKTLQAKVEEAQARLGEASSGNERVSAAMGVLRAKVELRAAERALGRSAAAEGELAVARARADRLRVTGRPEAIAEATTRVAAAERAAERETQRAMRLADAVAGRMQLLHVEFASDVEVRARSMWEEFLTRLLPEHLPAEEPPPTWWQGRPWPPERQLDLPSWDGMSKQDLTVRSQGAFGPDEQIGALLEIARRGTGQVIRPNQLMMALWMSEGGFVNLRMGGGKTLPFAEAAALMALKHGSAVVVSSHAYLARRDMQNFLKMFGDYGLNAARLDPDKPYASLGGPTVFYGTDAELVHGDQRDNMVPARALLADEADRTMGLDAPEGNEYATVRGGESPATDEVREKVLWARDTLDKALAARILTESDCRLLGPLPGGDRPSARLNPLGLAKIHASLGRELTGEELHRLNNMVTAHFDYPKNDAWFVSEEKNPRVVLISRTNHAPEGSMGTSGSEAVHVNSPREPGAEPEGARGTTLSRVEGGIHQALEAIAQKINPDVQILAEHDKAQRINSKEYYSREYGRFDVVAGGSGSLRDVSAERIEQLGWGGVRMAPDYFEDVLVVRDDLPVTEDEAASLRQVFDAAVVDHRLGRPVIVGAVRNSQVEVLFKMADAAGIPYRYIDAQLQYKLREHGFQAYIDELAGKGSEMIIGNFAIGRGFDKYVPQDTWEAGGLAVYGTARPDTMVALHQLDGRAARGGAPGSAQHGSSPALAAAPHPLTSIHYIPETAEQTAQHVVDKQTWVAAQQALVAKSGEVYAAADHAEQLRKAHDAGVAPHNDLVGRYEDRKSAYEAAAGKWQDAEISLVLERERRGYDATPEEHDRIAALRAERDRAATELNADGQRLTRSAADMWQARVASDHAAAEYQRLSKQYQVLVHTTTHSPTPPTPINVTDPTNTTPTTHTPGATNGRALLDQILHDAEALRHQPDAHTNATFEPVAAPAQLFAPMANARLDELWTDNRDTVQAALEQSYTDPLLIQALLGEVQATAADQFGTLDARSDDAAWFAGITADVANNPAAWADATSARLAAAFDAADRAGTEQILGHASPVVLAEAVDSLSAGRAEVAAKLWRDGKTVSNLLAEGFEVEVIRDAAWAVCSALGGSRSMRQPTPAAGGGPQTQLLRFAGVSAEEAATLPALLISKLQARARGGVDRDSVTVGTQTVASVLRDAAAVLEDEAEVQFLQLRLSGLTVSETTELLELSPEAGWALEHALLDSLAPSIVMTVLQQQPGLLERARPLLDPQQAAVLDALLSSQEIFDDALLSETVLMLGATCLSEWVPAVAVPSSMGPAAAAAVRYLAATTLDAERARLLRLMMWLPDQEIAEILGRSVSDIRNLLHDGVFDDTATARIIAAIRVDDIDPSVVDRASLTTWLRGIAATPGGRGAHHQGMTGRTGLRSKTIHVVATGGTTNPSSPPAAADPPSGPPTTPASPRPSLDLGQLVFNRYSDSNAGNYEDPTTPPDVPVVPNSDEITTDHRRRPGSTPPSIPDPIPGTSMNRWIRDLRIRFGMSQKVFAERLGMSRRGIGTIESGTTGTPLISILNRLRYAFGIPDETLRESARLFYNKPGWSPGDMPKPELRNQQVLPLEGVDFDPTASEDADGRRPDDNSPALGDMEQEQLAPGLPATRPIVMPAPADWRERVRIVVTNTNNRLYGLKSGYQVRLIRSRAADADGPAAILRAVDRLTPKQREAITFWLMNPQINHVARQLGLSVNAARDALGRAFADIATQLVAPEQYTDERSQTTRVFDIAFRHRATLEKALPGLTARRSQIGRAYWLNRHSRPVIAGALDLSTLAVKTHLNVAGQHVLDLVAQEAGERSVRCAGVLATEPVGEFPDPARFNELPEWLKAVRRHLGASRTYMDDLVGAVPGIWELCERGYPAWSVDMVRAIFRRVPPARGHYATGAQLFPELLTYSAVVSFPESSTRMSGMDVAETSREGWRAGVERDVADLVAAHGLPPVRGGEAVAVFRALERAGFTAADVRLEYVGGSMLTIECRPRGNRSVTEFLDRAGDAAGLAAYCSVVADQAGQVQSIRLVFNGDLATGRDGIWVVPAGRPWLGESSEAVVRMMLHTMLR